MNTPFIRYSVCSVFGLSILMTLLSGVYWAGAFERRAVQSDIEGIIHRYYRLYNQKEIVKAEDIVDQRLKSVSESGLIQSFLLKDAVLYDAYRYQNNLRHRVNYELIHQPERIHVQTTDDVVIAASVVRIEKRSKEDASLLEEKVNRITWVLSKKRDEWILLHEHQSPLE